MPLFGLYVNNQYKPILAHHYTSFIKKAVSSLRLDPRKYSSHSFRRGGRHSHLIIALLLNLLSPTVTGSATLIECTFRCLPTKSSKSSTPSPPNYGTHYNIFFLSWLWDLFPLYTGTLPIKFCVCPSQYLTRACRGVMVINLRLSRGLLTQPNFIFYMPVPITILTNKQFGRFPCQPSLTHNNNVFFIHIALITIDKYLY